jgi:Mg-chelatase subunit ChlD
MAAPPSSGVDDRFGVWGERGERGGEVSEEFRRGLDRKDIGRWFFDNGTSDGESADKGKLLVEEDKLMDDEVAEIVPRLNGYIAEGEDFVQQQPASDELSALAERFSTFSLHVSDVSFKLAMEALAKREWPEANKIRLEEFLNAIDYRDPLPGRDQQVACRIEQAAHPFMLQRNVLRIAVRTSALGRNSQTPLRLILLLDNSGSMQRADRAQTVRRAFEALASQLTSEDKVTLISFANVPRLLADQVSGNEVSKLIELINGLPAEGGTNLEAALQLATEKALEHQTEGTQSRIVLLTDGAVNLGDADPEKLAVMVLKMREALIAFDAAGISADGLNDEVLEALTRQGDGRYYLLGSAESVEDGFAQQIAGALRPSAKNVKVQVEFNPQRVGRYKLFGFERHRLQQEDFHNDQVDAAELAANEAGVALYQFEPLADGSGDIGTVAVRFQDLNTGEMVEQRWPIPYEASPSRIEQANSSLRIATAAVMFAAFLRGDALSESENLLTVATQLLADLPTRDRNQLRVQYLMAMIDNARALQGR